VLGERVVLVARELGVVAQDRRGGCARAFYERRIVEFGDLELWPASYEITNKDESRYLELSLSIAKANVRNSLLMPTCIMPLTKAQGLKARFCLIPNPA